MVRGRKNFLPPHPLIMGLSLLFKLVGVSTLHQISHLPAPFHQCCTARAPGHGSHKPMPWAQRAYKAVL